MPRGLQPRLELEIGNYGGFNNVLQFSQIPPSQSPSMKNAWMSKIGAIGKRPGTKPITASALGATIRHLTPYYTSAAEMILAASGTTLYKFDGTNAFTAQTMTNALVTSDIYTVAFTDANSNSILFITDGGNMKQYNGTAVADITPAADDASPAPPNDMTSINAKSPIYCWVYSSHIFVSDGEDIAWYSKRFYYDYFPSVQFERWVRENDNINGAGVEYGGLCLIPMRRGWGVLTGTTVDDFSGNQFLNTVNGVIAPRSIAKITYDTGIQTVAYLSDDGVYEVYDTGYIGSGVRQLATKSISKDKLDFALLGFTDAELAAAVAYFDPTYSMYILCIEHGGEYYAYCYDTRNGEWYPWTNIKAKTLTRFDGTLYYAGSEGHLRYFDSDLYSDWDDSAETTGSAVYFQRYSPLLSFEFSGFDSYWDYYLVEAKQWLLPSTIDLAVSFTNITPTVQVDAAWKTGAFVWGISKWGEAEWANLNFTDIVNAPNELLFHKKSKYAQIMWENNRDEPVIIFKEKWKGRASGR